VYNFFKLVNWFALVMAKFSNLIETL